MLLLKRLSENFIKDVTVWILPIAVIPVLRYIQDTENQNRKILLFRDLFSSSVGAVAFLGFKAVVKRLLRNSAIQRKDLAGTLVGTFVYLLLATTGVVKMTKWMEKYLQSRQIPPPIPPRPVYPQPVQSYPAPQPLSLNRPARFPVPASRLTNPMSRPSGINP